MFRFTFTVAVISVVLSACTRQPAAENLYPIDSLLTGQIRYLAATDAALIKFASLGNANDNKDFVPRDSAAWSDELGIFAQLSEINKPGNAANYIIDNELYDPGSNLTVKSLTALHNEPVQSLRVFFDKDASQPRKIEAIFRESNALYSSTRSLLMEFNQVNNKNVLTSYSIDGIQKMLFSDSVRFLIRGRIKLNGE